MLSELADIIEHYKASDSRTIAESILLAGYRKGGQDEQEEDTTREHTNKQ
jgi:hypothetical protein